MGKKNHSKPDEESMFTYKDEEDPKQDHKYRKRMYISVATGGITIISLIILASIFRNNLSTFSLIFSFYCIYLWTLPLLFTTLRSHQFQKLIKKERKKGRIYMVFAFYFLFLWLASLVSLLLYLGGLNITVMAYVIFYGSICVFIPYLLFVLIMKL